MNAYILGSGPPTLTVMVAREYYWHARQQEFVEEVRSSLERVLIEGGDYGRTTVPSGGIAGREAVLFIGPSVDASVEAWRVFRVWDVQQREDGTAIAVHPDRDYWMVYHPDDYQTYRSSLLEMELPAFKQAVTAANQARITEYGGRIAPATMTGNRVEGVEWPTLVSDANRLRQFFTNVGAYDHPDGPPSQPPARYTCDNDTTVTDPGTNRGLVRDCDALLEVKDTLQGTANLDWSANTAVTGWEGITTGGTPSRVTKVELPNESLSGSIPAELGNLFELTHLDLSRNSLTGDIPSELGLLENLEEIRLSGNSLTGCIPVALKDVAVNDLSSLNLLYCRPPAPENLSAGASGDTSVPLSWDAVANASKYRVEYRSHPSATYYLGDWTVASDTLTGTAHTVSGLDCNADHQFRVGAYGSGTVYAAEWSLPSAPLTESTSECVSPVFGESSYAFEVLARAGVGTVVGTV